MRWIYPASWALVVTFLAANGYIVVTERHPHAINIVAVVMLSVTLGLLIVCELDRRGHRW